MPVFVMFSLFSFNATIDGFTVLKDIVVSIGMYPFRILTGICSSNLKKAVESEDTKQH